MQVGQFAFQQQVVMVGTTDVAGAARSGAGALYSLAHCADHGGMLAHAQVIIGTPHRHIAHGTVHSMAGRTGKLAALALQLREIAVIAIGLQLIQLRIEKGIKIHWSYLSSLGIVLGAGNIQRQSFASGNGMTISQC